VGNQTKDRRDEVAAVIARGEWSGPMAAQLAAKWGVTVQSINNDRRRINGIRGVGAPAGKKGPTLHVLPKPGEDAPAQSTGLPMAMGHEPNGVAATLSKLPRSLALGWLLENVATGITTGDPASGAFVNASKEIRAILVAIDDAKKNEREALGDMSEDEMVALFRQEIEQLPKPALKKLRAALLTG
jgi:hypothetical protein